MTAIGISNCLMPHLQSLYNTQGEESVIRQYEGLTPIKRIYDRLIEETKPGDFYYIISDTDKFFDADPVYFKKFVEQRSKLKADLCIILRKSPEALFYKKIEHQINAKIKIVPKDKPLPANFSVTPQMLVVHQTEEPIMALVIENKHMIDLQKETFLSLWDSIEE